jgi:hypothetical protein
MAGPDDDLSRGSDAEQGGLSLDPPRRGAGCVSVGHRSHQRLTVPAGPGRRPAPTCNLDQQRGPWLQPRRGQVDYRPEVILGIEAHRRTLEGRQVAPKLERRHLGAVIDPLGPLVAQEEVEDVFTQGLGHEFG